MQDATFGNIDYEDGWVGSFSYTLLKQIVTTRLVIPCDKGDRIESAQREAFARFEADKDALVRSAEQAIYDYYRTEIVADYRERLGPSRADTMAPMIDDVRQIASIIRPTETIVQQSFGSDERIVGLLFDCSWDPSLGVAVKFVDETIDEVGTQDIVL